jgi:HSP20 family protein
MAGSHLPSMFGRDGGSLGSLFHDIEKTFEDFSRRMPFTGFGETTGPLATKINVAETKDGIEVTAELPGVDEKDVDITLSDDMLTVRGEKKVEHDEKDKNWHLVERSYGSFSRTIALPYEPDPAQVDAKFEKGVLRIRLPKPPEVAKKEKKIAIKSG